MHIVTSSHVSMVWRTMKSFYINSRCTGRYLPYHLLVGTSTENKDSRSKELQITTAIVRKILTERNEDPQIRRYLLSERDIRFLGCA